MSESVLYYADQGETLAAYRKSQKFFQCIMGPLGSAKTTTSIQKIIDLVTQQKPGPRGDRRTRGVVVRNTYPDLMNTTIRDFKGIVEPLRLGPMTMGHPPEMRMDLDLPDGTRVLAEIIFVALDKDDDVRKLRGMQLTWAYVNEMKEVPKSIIDMLQARVDRYPAQGSSAWTGIFGDTNAWDSDHWIEKIAEGIREAYGTQRIKDLHQIYGVPNAPVMTLAEARKTCKALKSMLAGASATATGVAAFVATAATANAGTASLLAQAAGGLIDLHLATGTVGYTLAGAVPSSAMAVSVAFTDTTSPAGCAAPPAGLGAALVVPKPPAITLMKLRFMALHMM